eukprot:Hpha_TRINITY_DN2051_c0_g1::TRINITY_DN2051_c0_g1_i1::g.83084::m.83084
MLSKVMGHPAAGLVVVPALHAAVFGAVYLACGGLSTWVGLFAWAVYFVVVVGAPLMHFVRRGPMLWIVNTVDVDVDAPKSICQRFIRDARNLDQYEQKVQGCEVKYPTEDGCQFTLSGDWFGLPFTKSFQLIYKPDGGFHSQMIHDGGEWLPWILRVDGAGGFKLTELSATSTRVIHYEKYAFPVSLPLLFLVAGAFTSWHLRGMEVEMGLIREQMVRLHQAGDTSAPTYARQLLTPEKRNFYSQKYTVFSYIKEAFLGSRFVYTGAC